MEKSTAQKENPKPSTVANRSHSYPHTPSTLLCKRHVSKNLKPRR